MAKQSSACSLLPELHHQLLATIYYRKKSRVPITLERLASAVDYPSEDVKWALADLVDQDQILLTGEYYFSQSPCSHTFLALTLDARSAASISSASDDLRCPQRAPADCLKSVTSSDSSSQLSSVPGGSNECSIAQPLSTVYLGKFYFPAQVRKALRGVSTYENTGALCHAMGEMVKSGVSLETIKLMIDEFCKHPQWFLGKPAWKVFLARREQLLALVNKRAESRKMEAHRFDRDYWLGTRKVSAPPCDISDPAYRSYWLGARA